MKTSIRGWNLLRAALASVAIATAAPSAFALQQSLFAANGSVSFPTDSSTPDAIYRNPSSLSSIVTGTGVIDPFLAGC